MDPITILGLIAGTCTTFSLLPQTIKSWKSSKTGDLSLPTYIVLVIGIILWIIYGIIKNDLPIIFANVIAFLFALSLLLLKIRYG